MYLEALIAAIGLLNIVCTGLFNIIELVIEKRKVGRAKEKETHLVEIKNYMRAASLHGSNESV